MPGSRHPGGRENEQIVTKYVAILFDSAHDREICQKMLRQVGSLLLSHPFHCPHLALRVVRVAVGPSEILGVAG